MPNNRTHFSKKREGALGKALIRSRFQHIRTDPNRDTKALSHQLIESEETLRYEDNLKSVTETNDLTTFMEKAVLEGTDFTAERYQVSLVSSPTVFSLQESPAESMASHQAQLRIPRRPTWDEDTTKEELVQSEKLAFLKWRQALDALEQNDSLIVTPFEKNINVWRQLWRVIERADVVVQIVDARNPLLFRCPDLEDYVRELDPGKSNLLLINKADLLPEPYRLAWARYFTENNIPFLFWSAVAAQREVDAKILADKAAAAGEEIAPVTPFPLGEGDARIVSRAELLDRFERLAATVPPGPPGRDGNPTIRKVVIGMVGYPNVGKSSTINALYGDKKTSVSSTPGKTKHFQTLEFTDRVTLCDCPGLVFPSFVSTRADMICNGVLPIDQMRAHDGPITLICRRIHRTVLENTYGVSLPAPAAHEDPNRPPTYEELLQAYGFVRGFMTERGLPDESRAARLILKDYANGRLVYCHPPPGGWQSYVQVSNLVKDVEELGKGVWLKRLAHEEEAEAEAAARAAVVAPDEQLVSMLTITPAMQRKVAARKKNTGSTFDTSLNVCAFEDTEAAEVQVIQARASNGAPQPVFKNKRMQRAHEKAQARMAAEEALRNKAGGSSGRGGLLAGSNSRGVGGGGGSGGGSVGGAANGSGAGRGASPRSSVTSGGGRGGKSKAAAVESDSESGEERGRSVSRRGQEPPPFANSDSDRKGRSPPRVSSGTSVLL